MAAELLPMLARAGDASNNPLSGAKWYFYEGGTTTPQAVYTTAVLSTAHANPVVADGAGKFAPIYFDASLTYRGILKSADDAITIFDIDPINNTAVSEFAAQRPLFDIRAMVGGDGEIAAALGIVKALSGKAWIAAGAYTLTGQFNQGNMPIEAAPDAVITAAGAGTSMLTSAGTFTQIADIDGNVSAGAGSILFAAAHGLAVGDWFVIYNPADYSWHGGRTYYRAGEWCQVVKVSGLTVYLARPLYDSYTAASVDVYKASLNRPLLRGGRWITGSKILAIYTGCTGLLADDFQAEGANSQTIYLDRCVGAVIRLPRIINEGDDGASAYGIIWGNSQHCRTYGGRVHSQRHPIAHGGGDFACAVPCRDIINYDVTLSVDPASSTDVGDFHGNTEKCYYDGCDLTGTLNWGGKDTGYRRCTVRSSPGGIGHIGEFGGTDGEIYGGRFELVDCHIEVTSSSVGTGRGIIDIGAGNASLDDNVKEDIEFVWSGGTFKLPNMPVDNILVRMHKTAEDASFPYAVDIRIEGPLLDLTNAQRILRTKDLSGAPASNALVVMPKGTLPAGSLWVVHDDNAFLDFPHRLPRQSGVWEYTTTATMDANSGGQNFAFPYPRAPKPLSAQLTGVDGAHRAPKLNTGTDDLSVAYVSATSDAATAGLSSNANFTAGTDVEVHWTVGMEEVE